MKIEGNLIAQSIYTDLKQRVKKLQEKGIDPHLAVILVGEDPASKAYVNQKQKRAQDINAKVTLFKYKDTITTLPLLQKVQDLSNDTKVHGIIIQRPLPSHIASIQIDDATSPQKDVDGFQIDSPYPQPLAEAVITIIKYIYDTHTQHTKPFKPWLHSKNIVIMGKGKTAGQPVINYFKEQKLPVEVIDSKTQNPESITRHADILISAIGKKDTIKPEHIKKGVILIGVGLTRGENGKLHGDYNEEEVAKKASFYTPSPGGVGPVNVAMLLKNLVLAAEKQYTTA